MLNEIKTFLGQDWKDAEDLVRSSLASDIELLDKTNEAILSSTGKQLRPLISLLVARHVQEEKPTGTASAVLRHRNCCTTPLSSTTTWLTVAPREGECRPSCPYWEDRQPSCWGITGS